MKHQESTRSPVFLLLILLTLFLTQTTFAEEPVNATDQSQIETGTSGASSPEQQKENKTLKKVSTATIFLSAIILCVCGNAYSRFEKLKKAELAVAKAQYEDNVNFAVQVNDKTVREALNTVKQIEREIKDGTDYLNKLG